MLSSVSYESQLKILVLLGGNNHNLPSRHHHQEPREPNPVRGKGYTPGRYIDFRDL